MPFSLEVTASSLPSCQNTLGAVGEPSVGVIKNAILVLATTMLMIIVVEITMFIFDSAGLFPHFFKGLEMMEPNFDLNTGSGLYYSHPYISYEMRPGYQREGWAHINSLGFRGDPIAENKRPGTYRIVALGDSVTYGIYNRYDETYPYLLQEQLRDEFTTDRIEVINAGLVSSTTAENMIRFFLHILPLEPDMLILYSGGDMFPRVFNNYKGDYSHFRRTPIAKSSLIDKSYVGRLLKQGVIWKLRPESELKNSNLLEYTWNMQNMPLDNTGKIKNFNNSGSNTFRRNLKYIIDAALINEVKPVLVTFAFNKDGAKWLQDIPEEVWSKGIDEGNEVVLELAQKYQLPLCNFYEYGLKDKRIFKDSIHLNAYGNAKLAECVREAIKGIVQGNLASSTVGEGASIMSSDPQR
jgi:lysophospholipase L1-like esterase